MTLLSDTLVAQAGEGEPVACECLLSLMEPLLRSVARNTINVATYHLWSLDDALQVAKLACVQFAGLCRDVVALPAYLGTIVLRECLKERCLYADGWVLPRHVQAVAEIDADELAEDALTIPAAEEDALRNIECARVREAVNRLPPHLREVVMRRSGLDGRAPANLRQIATEIGTSHVVILKRERQAFERLHGLLERR